jgi:hypothetical protein
VPDIVIAFIEVAAAGLARSEQVLDLLVADPLEPLAPFDDRAVR